MEVVLAGLAREVCLVYLDDVLLMGKTLEEHNKNLAKVLYRLHVSGLRLKPKKCCFAQLQVEYFGHVVSAEGVSDFPTPLSMKDVCSFVGLASYNRKLIPNFSAGPKLALTKKHVAFVWTPQCQSAYEKLKHLMTTAPFVVYPNFE